MKISFSKLSIPRGGVLALCVAEGNRLGEFGAQVDERCGGLITRALKKGSFKGKHGQTLMLVAPVDLSVHAILLVGIGKPQNWSETDPEKLGGGLVKAMNGGEESHVHFAMEGTDKAKMSAADIAARVGYGALLGSYRFDRYYTKEDKHKTPAFDALTVMTSDVKGAEAGYGPLSRIADGIFLTRDLVSEPANVLYPKEFARRCKELKELGVKVTILGVKEMEELGMGSLLGVGQGSAHDSQLAVLEWNGLPKGKTMKPLAFVGKGVTFDTGGISIKPAAGMEEMKFDMGGAGTVTGLMKALAGRKAKVHAVGVLGLVENMPSHKAQRPGDVVKSASGQTIEVINTDAEGRLVLADALWYVQEKHDPQLIIDLATLTGAIIVTLGHEYAGLFSNDDQLSKRLKEAGEAEGEGVWRLPMGDVYDKMMDSDIADMKNTGGRQGGSITAAQFLKRFVKDGMPWVHLDIAGVAWKYKASETVPKGGSGWGVRLLNRLVADNYEQKDG
jgi:leucyl aminopeptidase